MNVWYDLDNLFTYMQFIYPTAPYSSISHDIEINKNKYAEKDLTSKDLH